MPRERRRREKDGNQGNSAPVRQHTRRHTTPTAARIGSMPHPGVPAPLTSQATPASSVSTGPANHTVHREPATETLSGAATVRMDAQRHLANSHIAPDTPDVSRTDAQPQATTTSPSDASPKPTVVLPDAPRELELEPIPPPGAKVSALTKTRAAESRPLFIQGSKRAPRSPVYRVVPRRKGPRSFASPFVVALAATVAFCSVVALATPLTASLGVAANVQAYANSVPWVPTPTYTPRPTPATQGYAQPAQGANPGQQAIINEIKSVFGPYASGALAIARCESGYDPNAWNTYAIGNSHASGVFQILYPSTWDGTSYAKYSPFNADANIHAAYQIFSRDGHTWREWACKPY